MQIKVTVEMIENESEESKIIGVMNIIPIAHPVYKDDYLVTATESGMDTPTEIRIKDHPRGKSPWGLVAKGARLTAGNMDRRVERRK